MIKNLDDLIAKVEIVLKENDTGDPEYIEIKNDLIELTFDDRQQFLQKLDLREDGPQLREKVCEFLEICAELDEMQDEPAPFDPSTFETTGLAGDPTTDPDEEI